MRKFYVSSGTMQEVLLASTREQACIKAMRRLDNPIKIGTRFRVSERGFDAHYDDFFINTSTIISLMILAASDDEVTPV